MNEDIVNYNRALAPTDQQTCELLAKEISRVLPEAEDKIWHGHPVWFLDGNPVVGFSKHKDGIRLLFWSGQSFRDANLSPAGKFKAVEVRYTASEEVNKEALRGWLADSRDIQWDYKNIVKRKGKLERLK